MPGTLLALGEKNLEKLLHVLCGMGGVAITLHKGFCGWCENAE